MYKRSWSDNTFVPINDGYPSKRRNVYDVELSPDPPLRATPGTPKRTVTAKRSRNSAQYFKTVMRNQDDDGLKTQTPLITNVSANNTRPDALTTEATSGSNATSELAKPAKPAEELATDCIVASSPKKGNRLSSGLTPALQTLSMTPGPEFRSPPSVVSKASASSKPVSSGSSNFNANESAPAARVPKSKINALRESTRASEAAVVDNSHLPHKPPDSGPVDSLGGGTVFVTESNLPTKLLESRHESGYEAYHSDDDEESVELGRRQIDVPPPVAEDVTPTTDSGLNKAAYDEWEKASQALHDAAMDYHSDKDLPLDEYAPVDSDSDIADFYQPFPEPETSTSNEQPLFGTYSRTDQRTAISEEPDVENAHDINDFDPPFSKETSAGLVKDLDTLYAEYIPDRDHPLQERPTEEDVKNIQKFYYVPITRNTEKAIPGLGNENLWLTAIIGHNSQADPEIREYDCLIQRTSKTLEHAKFTGEDLALYAPAALATYLVNLGERPLKPLPSTKQTPDTLWFIESHRLTAHTYESNDMSDTTAYSSDEDNGQEDAEHWVVDLYCRFTDGSEKWVSEIDAQKDHNAAVLTYWAGSREGVREWVQNHPDYRTLKTKDGRPKKVEHWILKVLGHEYTTKAKPGRTNPKKMTMHTQYCGYPAGHKWWGFIKANKLRSFDPAMYDEYFAKGLNSEK